MDGLLGWFMTLGLPHFACHFPIISPKFTRKVTSHPSESNQSSTNVLPKSLKTSPKIAQKITQDFFEMPNQCSSFSHRNPRNTSPIPVPGMTDEETPSSELRAALSEAIQLLEDLRSAAVTYVGGRRQQGWSEQLGLYFHVFGHNSVTLENNFGGV